MGLIEIQKLTRWLISISFAAFGAHQIVYGKFVTRVIGEVPAWIPWHAFWAEATGAAMMATAIAAGFGKRKAALALGIGSLVSAAFLHFPVALASARHGGAWVSFGKGLTLMGCMFAVAGSLRARLFRMSSELLVVSGKWALGAFMILSGVLHFVYSDFVASLLPPWIPWHMFWTYFAGILLICGGLGMMMPVTTRLATPLSGIMILSWVPLVHIPLAWKNLGNPGQSVPVFEALAFGSLAILAYATERIATSGDEREGRAEARFAAAGKISGSTAQT